MIADFGATGCGWHTLRHTFGTRVALRAALQKVQKWLGHSDIRMTMIYTHVGTSYDPDVEAASW